MSTWPVVLLRRALKHTDNVAEAMLAVQVALAVQPEPGEGDLEDDESHGSGSGAFTQPGDHSPEYPTPAKSPPKAKTKDKVKSRGKKQARRGKRGRRRLSRDLRSKKEWRARAISAELAIRLTAADVSQKRITRGARAGQMGWYTNKGNRLLPANWKPPAPKGGTPPGSGGGGTPPPPSPPSGAGTPPTPPSPPPKPPRPLTPRQRSVQDAKKAVAGITAKITAGQYLTTAEVAALPAQLKLMTIAEIKEAQKAIGLGSRAGIKQQQIDRVIRIAQGRVPPPPAPPPSPPSPAQPVAPFMRGAAPSKVNLTLTAPATQPPVPYQAVTDWETGKAQPGSLNGIDFAPAPPKFWEQVADADVGEPPTHAGKKVDRVGIMIVEPDGRMWIVQPTNGFGNRKYTLPGGRVEPGLTDQQNALKETWEETGIQCEITGYLGDFEDSNNGNNGRLYIGRRIGGEPWGAKIESFIKNAKTGQSAAESEKVTLATPEEAAKLLHRTDDLAQLMAVAPIKVNTPTSGTGSEPLKKFLRGIAPAVQKYKEDKKASGEAFGNAELHVVQEMRGFNDKPNVVKKADFDNLIQQGGYIEVLRGVGSHGKFNATDLANQYKTGDHFPGHGVFGSGTYTDSNKGAKNVATQYSGAAYGMGGRSGAVMRIAIPKTARIIKESELERLVPKNPKLFAGYWATGGKMPEECWLGMQAVLAGYDAIEVDGNSPRHRTYGKGFYVILNRSIVTVQEEDATGHQIQ